MTMTSPRNVVPFLGLLLRTFQGAENGAVEATVE
jgi:hypothetical protein